MKLTDKDLRHIRNKATGDAWLIDDGSSEYANLYKLTERIAYLESKTNKQ